MVITSQPRIREQWNPTGRRDVQDYYVVRECPDVAGDYWAPKVDPDGVLRNRDTEEERLRYLEDVADEIAFAKSCKPEWILDIGAGLGWFLDAVKVEKRGYIEISPYCLKRLYEKGIFAYSSLEELKHNHVWDVVVMHHVIEHLSDPIQAICHVHRLLKRGGYLILGTPDFASPCAKRFGDKYRMLHDPTHRSLFTLESMHRFLRDHGFTILDVKFPFPDRYATAENFMRWNDTSRVSPPWPGNWMTFYCQR